MKTTGIHVLIAEDDAAHASAIRRAFEAGGPETVIKVVGTLREFRQRSVEWPPNIAVMDLNLPDGRAVEVLTSPPEAGPFPVLVMTSYGNEQVAVEAIKSGALDYVVKSPEAFADMPHTVTRVLHEWKLLQERKRAEEALEFQNIILSTQQETSLDGILVTDENGEIISFNRRFVEIWGIPSDVAESKSDEPVLQSVMDKLASPGEFVGKLEHLHEARDETSRDEIALKDGRTFDRYSAPMLGAAGQYLGRVWYFRDITKRKQAEMALREEEEWFRSVFENASDGLFFLSENFEIISVNKSFAAMHGYSVAEILKMDLKKLDTLEDQRLASERMRRILAGESLTFEVNHRHKQGHLFPLEVTANLVTMGTKKYVLASHRDITVRKQAENELRYVNRALRLTSLCNQEMVRATDEPALLQAICRIAVEHGGYRMAWVGFAEQNETKSVRPMAQAGFEEGYLKTVNITWADAERGCGPTGTAIRTGQPVLARNIPTDPAFGPWRAAAIQRGYGSSIALPLLSEGRCFGALMMYAAEVDAFNPKEIELLAEMANDLAYGISALQQDET